MAEAQLPRDVDNEGEQGIQPATPLQPVATDLIGFDQASTDVPAGNGHAIERPQWDTSNVIALRASAPPVPVTPPAEEVAVWADAEPEQATPSRSLTERLNGHAVLVPADPAVIEAALPDDTELAPKQSAEIAPLFPAAGPAEHLAAAAQPLPAAAVDPFEVGLLVPRIDVPIFTEPEADGSAAPQAARPEAGADEPEPALASLPLAATEPEVPAEAPAAGTPDVPPDTAEKIAAEANATAIALEALKQLLTDKLPELQAAAARQAANRLPPNMRVAPPRMMPAHIAPSMPHTRPRPRRRTGAMIGSFLAGFSLSWVVGAVLYVYLTMG